jgi:hypothetical protein
LIACVAIAGCTHTKVKSAAPAMLVQPAADSKGLLIHPDVQLSLLTASGMEAVRKDWSTAAEANLTSAIVEDLKARSHPFELFDPQASMQGRTGQLLRLHEAVGDSVQFFEYGDSKLPTKKKKFDWTLGEGTRLLRQEKGADYALFVTGRGSYATTERKILSVGALLLLQNVPLGKQQVMASLVDLRTGRLVWFNVTTAGSGTDIRTPVGARDLSRSLLKDIPL